MRSRPSRAWSCSTRCSRSSAARRRISPCAGTARPRSAARAAPRSTAGRGLMCKTRLDRLPADRPIRVEPLHAFPIVRDLVTDVSWNYEVNKRIAPFTPKPDATWPISQEDVDRMSEFRKCIECFLCQDVCHVLRDHDHEPLLRPRFLVRIACLKCTRSTRRPDRHRRARRASASATSRSAAPRSARGHPHHRQRDHPAQGARRRPALRPAPAPVSPAPVQVTGCV